jgi:hypothetical protein
MREQYMRQEYGQINNSFVKFVLVYRLLQHHWHWLHHRLGHRSFAQKILQLALAIVSLSTSSPKLCKLVQLFASKISAQAKRLQ